MEHTQGRILSFLQLETKKESSFLLCFSVSIFGVRPVLYITFREMSQLSRYFTGNAILWLEQLTSLAASHFHSTAGSAAKEAFCVTWWNEGKRRLCKDFSVCSLLTLSLERTQSSLLGLRAAGVPSNLKGISTGHMLHHTVGTWATHGLRSLTVGWVPALLLEF